MAYRPISFLSFVLVLMTTLLMGCSMPFMGGALVKTQSDSDFARYVEEVFRLQNSVTSELLVLSESDNVNDNINLSKAEYSMQEACGPLNEYAEREKDGASIGFFLLQRVKKSAVACEKAAQFVKIQLKN